MNNRKLFVLTATFSVIIVSIVLLATLTGSQSLENSQLIGVFIVARHGDRTPEHGQMQFYPNNPYLNQDFYPHGFGALTNSGKKRAYSYGEYLRKMYSEFLSELYIPSEIKVKATAYERTVASALSLLAALYRPVPDQIFEAGLNWQPVPVWPTNHNDPMLMYFTNCNKYVAEAASLLMQNYGKFSKYDELYEELSNYTGYEGMGPTSVLSVYDVLTGQQNSGLPLPEWFLDLRDEIEEQNDLLWTVLFESDLSTQLASGTLLESILDDSDVLISHVAEDNTNSTSSVPKFNLLLAHDATVAPLMKATQLGFSRRPGYLSSLTLELRRDIASGDYGFEFVYIHQFGDTEPEKMRVRGCGDEDFCEISKFKELVGHILLKSEDHAAACYTNETVSRSNFLTQPHMKH